MPQSLDVEQEVGLLPWNCTKCSSKGPSAVLHPEVEWCKYCGRTKLSSAETVLGNFVQAILKTWEGDSTEEIGDLVVTTIKVEEIRDMIWHPHGRYNAGMLERPWNDAQGQSV